jgi:lysophospholipase L1-like esterase
VGSSPWKASTAYALGAVVSKGGNAYIATVGGTSGASWMNTRAIGQTDGTVTWDYIGKQTAPAFVATNGGTADATLTKVYTVSAYAGLPAGRGPFMWRGGVPSQNKEGTGFYGTVSATMAPAAGTLTATKNQASSGSVSFMCDCTRVEFGLLQGGRPYNIIVDGQNIDRMVSTGASTAGTTRYISIDFAGVAAPADAMIGGGTAVAIGRGRHLVEFEFSRESSIKTIAVEPTSTISYPEVPEEWSIAVLADSQGTGVLLGTVLNPTVAWPNQMRKLLNAPDICNASIGGTGLVAPGGSTPYSGHAIVDLSACNAYRPIKFIVVQGSQNDNAEAAATITAASATLLASLRAAYPTVPIFVTGVVKQPAVALATVQANETAAFAGAAGISNVYTIPFSTASEPWFNGTGKETATTGDGNNDFLILSDGNHLSQQGHNYMARRIVQAILDYAQRNP